MTIERFSSELTAVTLKESAPSFIVVDLINSVGLASHKLSISIFKAIFSSLSFLFFSSVLSSRLAAISERIFMTISRNFIRGVISCAAKALWRQSIVEQGRIRQIHTRLFHWNWGRTTRRRQHDGGKQSGSSGRSKADRDQSGTIDPQTNKASGETEIGYDINHPRHKGWTLQCSTSPGDRRIPYTAVGDRWPAGGHVANGADSRADRSRCETQSWMNAVVNFRIIL